MNIRFHIEITRKSYIRLKAEYVTHQPHTSLYTIFNREVQRTFIDITYFIIYITTINPSLLTMQTESGIYILWITSFGVLVTAGRV